MNDNAEKIIVALNPEIEKKCAEIYEAKKVKMQTRIFVFLCIAAIVLPIIFIICGFSLITLIIPVIFMAVTFLILSPIIIKGDHTYEQI